MVNEKFRKSIAHQLMRFHVDSSLLSRKFKKGEIQDNLYLWIELKAKLAMVTILGWFERLMLVALAIKFWGPHSIWIETILNWEAKKRNSSIKLKDHPNIILPNVWEYNCSDNLGTKSLSHGWMGYNVFVYIYVKWSVQRTARTLQRYISFFFCLYGSFSLAFWPSIE